MKSSPQSPRRLLVTASMTLGSIASNGWAGSDRPSQGVEPQLKAGRVRATEGLELSRHADNG